MIRPEEEGMEDPAEKLVADVRAGMQQLEDGMASRFDEGVADRIKRQGRERLRTDTRRIGISNARPVQGCPQPCGA
jgi:hypothetical protein